MEKKQKGQTLVEIVLAVGIFVTLAGGITVLVLGSLLSERQGGELTQATSYMQEGSEAVRSIGEEAWNKLAYMDDGATHGLDNGSGVWDFSGTSNTDGKYTRTIDVDSVTRDGGGDINPGTNDLETKEITVTTDWDFAPGRPKQTVSVYNLTNWNRGLWTETTDADFNDGTFSNTVANSDTLILSGSGGTTDSNSWDFSTSGEYTFDPLKIEVTGGQASLVGSGGTVSGSTTDPGFDTGAPWTSGTWDQGGSDYVFNNRYPTYGNPTWWVYSYLRGRNNAELGGYWQQAFTTTVDDPDVSVTLDYQPWTRTLQANDHGYFYAFVDSSPGAPASPGNAVWSHEFVAGDPVQTWVTGNTFTDSGNVTTAGTYYLKVALWLDNRNAGGNPYRYLLGGYDNVQLDWTKTTVPTYPSDNPPINPTGSWDPDNKVVTWTSFTETATKNGGEIYYQLSSDGGTTWQYWNGSAWVTVVGATDYNTASQVNSQITSFDTSTGIIMFKAFLSSDGTYDVLLDNIDITAEIETITMEVGEVTTDETWATVSTANTYTSPVVTALYEEQTGSNAAYSVSTRVRNAGSNSFQIRIEDPSGADLGDSRVRYIVMEEGAWDMGSTKVEAHKESIATVARKNNWIGDNKGYDQTYASNPLVLHQVMSDNDTRWIESWVSSQGNKNDPPNTSGFQIAMNAAEVAASYAHNPEILGWIVVQAGQDDSIDGNNFRTRITGDTVRGHANGCYNQNYGTTFISPYVVADQETMDGGDGGWLVECALSGTAVGVHVEEDQEGDPDRSHTTEIAAYVVFEDSFSVSGKGGYSPSGTYESSDFGTASNFNLIKWTETVPPSTDLRVQIKTAPDASGSPGAWSPTWCGPEGEDGDETDYFTNPAGELIHPDHIGDNWIKYKLSLTGPGSDTPILADITVNYKP
ncbi:hypothetical protein KKH43_00650 [Patescibacteria group bacterium]|nr:hypothetical protein [Patescibacteria group bacterium]